MNASGLEDPRDGEILSGGRTTPGVIRIGATVRRPASARSGFIASLLQYLESISFDGTPRYLGQDSNARDVLSFVPGDVPADLRLFSDRQLTKAAALIRAFHDATTGFAAKGDAEVVCHGDLSPCNCVFRDGIPRAFIDFDGAIPGDRRDDVGYAAWLWLDLGNEYLEAKEQGRRLQLFLAAYGLGIADPVGAILAAQRHLAAESKALKATRQWARACEQWTSRHLSGFSVSV